MSKPLCFLVAAAVMPFGVAAAPLAVRAGDRAVVVGAAGKETGAEVYGARGSSVRDAR